MNKDTKTYLEKYGIKPSAQRIAIMDYLLNNRTHPSVDEIYTALVETYPTLSRTTVYNTLNLFAEHKAILSLNLVGNTVHYDGDINPHSHFYCINCNQIFDITIQDNSFFKNNIPDGFQVDDIQLYYKGICINCLKNKNYAQEI